VTSTRFAPGPATAYVCDDVIAVVDRAGAEPDLMHTCVDQPSWDALVAMVRDHDDVAVVMTTDTGVRAAVKGAMTVVVDELAGRTRIEGSTEVSTQRFPTAQAVSIMSPGGADSDPTYCVDAGAVPVSLVRRALAGDEVPTDAFEALFGRTVERSVEQAAVRVVDADRDRGRAPFGVLVFSNGERVIADRTIVLGRNPHRCEDGAVASEVSRLRRVVLPAPAVSRRHAVVHVDRWHAAIDDLGSSNGTWVTLPGGAPRRVRAGQPVDLVPGAVVDLGGDISFAVEEVA